MARYVPKVDYGRLEFEYVPSSGFYRARISTDNSFKKDTDYAVVFDGRRYTVRSTANGAIGGNAYLYDQRKPDTGEPFYLAPAMGLVMASTAGFHSVSYGIMKADGGDNVDERLDGLEKVVDSLSEEIEGYFDDGIIRSEALPEGYPYTKTTNEVIFNGEVTTPTGTGAGQGNPISFNVVEGRAYTVTFDGIVYEIEGKSSEYGNYLGNLNLGLGNGYNEGEIPFFYGAGFFVAAEDGTHTIQITCVLEEIQRLDEKYLPATGGYDLVFGLNVILSSSITDPSRFTIESGSVLDTIAKMRNNELVKVAIHSKFYDEHMWCEAVSVHDMGFDNRLKCGFVTLNENAGETVDTYQILAMGESSLIVIINNQTLGD